ncbi:MAG: ABC transporter ATP-binding protein/permease [Ligilactobacillus agilis]|uniref:ABC transporter ATP-binding protein n=1 Tax=Ligilactobacillus agilis TaxID=1601 RepID=UPI0024303103|nr:ABC transporter ATP-binding protein [Ligilactobacillus agilis]MCI5760936.1 ABC transporter ATP-binding protein/permease [Ligilactobacillus agilis]
MNKKVINLVLESLYSRKQLVVGILISLISSALSMILPFIISQAVNKEIIIELLRKPYLIVGVVGLVVIIYFMQGLSSFILSRVAAKSMEKLQNIFFEHLIKLPVDKMSEYSSGDLASRATNDIGQVAQLLATLIPKMFINSLLILCGICILVKLNLLLTLLLIGAIPIIYLVVGPLNKKVEQLYKKRQEILGTINANVSQKIKGITFIKAYKGENSEVVLNRKFTNRLANIVIKLLKVSILYNSLVWCFLMLIIIGVVFISSYLVVEQKMASSFVLAYILYLCQIITPILGILTEVSEFFEAKGSLSRVSEVMNVSAEKLDKNSSKCIEDSINIKNLTFSYDNRKMTLHNVNIEVPSKKKIAIVGPSGAGKSTILAILMGFYKNYSGDIYIGKINIKDIPLMKLREGFSYISQESFLFRGKIIDNIKYGKNTNVSNEKILALIDRFNLMSQLDSNISVDGTGLSGGQKQKINVARAMASNAKILLIDEATASMDRDSEKVVMDEILKTSKTCLIVAHNINTIKNVDNIYVLDENGTVENQGRHEFLLKTDSLYQSYIKNMM